MRNIKNEEPFMVIFGRLKAAIFYNQDLERAKKLMEKLEKKLLYTKIEENYYENR